MKTIYDIQQFLKSYGTIIYTGNRIGDLELMREELSELHRSNLIEQSVFDVAVYLLDREIILEQEKKG